MARRVIVDGVNLDALGVTNASVEGRLGDRFTSLRTEKVPGRDGVVVVATQPSVDARLLQMEFTLEAATRSELLTLRDQVASLLSVRIPHTFRFVDDETRETTGFVTQRQFPAIPPDLSQPACRLLATVMCPDPREYATTDTVVSGISGDTALPLGPERSDPVIVVTGAGTFTLTYKNSAGGNLKVLQISGAAAPVTIDMATGSITDNNGEAAEFLVAGSDFPFFFDPDDGDFIASAWPTLACSAGSAEATYRKAY